MMRLLAIFLQRGIHIELGGAPYVGANFFGFVGVDIVDIVRFTEGRIDVEDEHVEGEGDFAAGFEPVYIVLFIGNGGDAAWFNNGIHTVGVVMRWVSSSPNLS